MNQLSQNSGNHEKLQWQVGKVGESNSWLIPALAAAWFIGLIVLYIMYQKTDISFTQTIQLFLLFAVGFTLIPYKWVLKVIRIEYSMLIGMNVIGIGPLFTSLFLILNFLFSTSNVTRTYQILDCGPTNNPFEHYLVRVELGNNSLEAQPKLRQFDSVYLFEILDSDSIILTIGKGLFGYDVRKDYMLVPKDTMY